MSPRPPRAAIAIPWPSDCAYVVLLDGRYECQVRWISRDRVQLRWRDLRVGPQWRVIGVDSFAHINPAQLDIVFVEKWERAFLETVDAATGLDP